MRRHRTLMTSERSADLDRPVTEVWSVVASAERTPQWYVDAAPLRFRGALDRLVGGERPAPPPGRPLLAVGDRAGFWEVVEADHADHQLVLEARVRAPGRVQLTVTAVPGIGETPGTHVGLQVAFEPDGVLGRLYLLTDLAAREVVTELTMLHLLTVLRR